VPCETRPNEVERFTKKSELPQAVANERTGAAPGASTLEALARRARTLARDSAEGDDLTREELAKLARHLDDANLARPARRARLAVTAIEEQDLDLAAEQMSALVEDLLGAKRM
jgi:hypothetical protein